MSTPEASRPPLPPFDSQSAASKVRMAEDAWNTRDPQRVALAYTPDSVWRNRSEFLVGREEIQRFLTRKWAKELDYRLIKELWACQDNRIAVRFAYEWHDDSGNWFRSYGNENWEFDDRGFMKRRIASINDLPIAAADRKYHWPLGRRPDDHAGLSALGLCRQRLARADPHRSHVETRFIPGRSIRCNGRQHCGRPGSSTAPAVYGRHVGRPAANVAWSRRRRSRSSRSDRASPADRRQIPRRSHGTDERRGYAIGIFPPERVPELQRCHEAIRVRVLGYSRPTTHGRDESSRRPLPRFGRNEAAGRRVRCARVGKRKERHVQVSAHHWEHQRR